MSESKRNTQTPWLGTKLFVIVKSRFEALLLQWPPWVSCCFKSPATRLFVRRHFLAKNKGNINTISFGTLSFVIPKSCFAALSLQWLHMSAMPSSITVRLTFCSTACHDWEQKKHPHILIGNEIICNTDIAFWNIVIIVTPWASWRFKSPADRILVQHHVLAKRRHRS